MSDRCNHDLFEQDTYIADGYCPLCLLDLLQSKDAEIERLRDELQIANDFAARTVTRADILKLKAEIERLQSKCDRLSARGIEDMKYEIERLQAVVDAALIVSLRNETGDTPGLYELREALAALETDDE